MSQPRGQPERSKSYGSWVFWRRFRDVRDTTNAASKTIEVQPRSQPSPSREPPLGTSTVMSEVVSDQPNKPRRSNDGDTGPGDGEEYHGNHESGPPEAHAELGELELEPLRDLWAEAWESDDVGDERRTLLRGKWGDGEVEELGKGPKDLINNVIALTEYKLGTYARRWGVEDNKATSGKARSILLSALTVKEIIETGFKFDPTGCGSAAWAVVSFGLKLVQNDRENMDLTFESCEFLADLMARYTRIEVLYWKRKIKDVAFLEDAIIKVYIAILRYSAEVKESSQSHIIHRTRRSILALTGQPLEKLKHGIVDRDKIVEDWQKQIDREEHHKISEKLEGLRKETSKMADDLEKTNTNMEAVKEMALGEESREMFKWLFNEGSAGQNKTHKELRDAIENSEGGDYKAGQWLFEMDEYRNWRKYPQSLLWLHADSGFGKSSLCSTIIQNLEDSFEKDDTKVLMYWYFRFYIDETKKIDLLFRSLLRQLGSKCRRFPDDTLNWLRSYRDSGKSMKTDQLFKNLSGFISKADKDIFIVLDGLDEFPEDSKEAKRSQLLDHITALASAGHPNLHIALISKDEKDIRHELENKLKDILVPVNINKKLNEDLDNFITRKMNGMSLLTPSLKQDIQKKLEKGDDRNFLYATSLFNEVADCQNGIEIRDAIERVPGSMAAIYQKALETVREERAGSMKLILIWLMRQLRPLTRNEIAAAVGLAEPAMVTRICTKALVEPCSQVVSVAGRHRSLEVLRFTHSSAKDYLETVLLQFPKPRDDGIGRFVFSDEDVNLQMTQRCLKILVSCSSDHTFDDDAKSETQVGLPLLQYAAEYWFLHYNLINRKKLSSIDLEALEHDVYSLFKPGNHTFAFWLNIYNPDYLPPTFQTLFDPIDRKLAESVEDEEVVFPSPVYYAVKLGLPNIALGLIEQNEDAEMLNRSGSEGTTLQLVARRGHYKILDALLKRGVPVNSPAGRHGTALYAASTRGDKAFVKRLLDSGATSNGSEDGILGSPLHVAAFYGNVSVIDQLLEPGHLQVDHLAGPFGTALQAASAGKRIDAVDLLLKHHANPNIVGGCLGTAIQAALSASEGYAGEAHTIVDTLKNAQAQYREDYVFWTTAYNRVRLQFSLEQAGVISGIRGGAAPFELEWPQSLFASSLCTWNLPSISELVEVNNFLPQHSYWHKIPWCLQLKEILRAAPRLETNAEELSRKDFRHRALFWSGMNRIFEYLSPLLRYTYRSLVFGFQPSEDSHLLAFKWIHVDRDTLNPGVLNPLYEQYLELSGRYSRHYPSFRYLSRNPYMTAMDRSDRIEADLTKYTERFDLDATDRGLIDKLDSLEQMVLVINSLLPLIRDLLQYTDRCSRYHAEAIERTDSISNNTVEIIEDLTYELFSAVLRLWICVDQTQPSMVGFFRTIKLLSTIRLERIRELDAKCEKLLTQELLAGIKGREERYEEMTREALEQIQSTVVDQVADLKAGIATQLSEWQPSLTQEIETLVSAAVKSEVSQALGKVQDELRSQIRDEVREELLGAQARSA